MKKLLSIVLAVAMMSVMVFSASAADIDILAKCADGKIYPNDANYATMTANEDGSYEVVVTKDASADFSTAYGLAIEPFMENVNLNDTPNLVVSLTSDAPFRITLLDRGPSGDKWISFGSEFFNTFYAEGTEAPATAPENNFFPAGTYNCHAFFKGFYDWQANNGGVGFDPAAANIIAIYIELKEAGTLKLSKMALSASETGGDESGDNGSDTTTTKPVQDDSKEPPKTGDVSNAVVFAAAMIAAGAVVMTTVVVSKKAKSR